MKTEKAAEPFDLMKFPFPKTDAVDFAFPTHRADPVLLAEAKAQGFYNGHTEGNKMFSTLFYSGGKVNFKKDVDPAFKAAAWPYCRAFMGSWAPKHEEKEAICALLLTALADSVEAKRAD